MKKVEKLDKLIDIIAWLLIVGLFALPANQF